MTRGDICFGASCLVRRLVLEEDHRPLVRGLSAGLAQLRGVITASARASTATVCLSGTGAYLPRGCESV